MAYLKWDQKKIITTNEPETNRSYDEGYLFGRLAKGTMDQTRSIRIDLANFSLSSENRRVLRKTEQLSFKTLPLPYSDYSWHIGKMGKDFYDKKFGEKTFSANKIKELITDKEKSNFNNLFIYSVGSKTVGYCITVETAELLHYAYPFYSLTEEIPNLGLGMMLRAISWAKETNKKYVYIGSAQRPADVYKLQFEGSEWFDGKKWQSDLSSLKQILNNL